MYVFLKLRLPIQIFTGFATCQILYIRVLVVSLPIGKVQNLHPRMDKLKKNEKYIKIFF